LREGDDGWALDDVLFVDETELAALNNTSDTARVPYERFY
jgi:hypothetical protein